ncbi:MAG: hypothetical protein WBW79_07850 [Desulfocapsaceae bacterium]|jgi:hypothetical protein
MKNKDLTKSDQGAGALRQRSSSSEIASFLKVAGEVGRPRSGRLIFALDATMSRQPTWDRAMTHQASMFDAVGQAGGLAVQLVYFRGLDECRASKWVINARALRDLMLGIGCVGGQTQIGKVLRHAVAEATKTQVAALIYIGDAIEERIEDLYSKAGELGVRGVRCFFFQDGNDTIAELGFREMARLSGGAYLHLGPDSAKELAELLGAVAVYARGGLQALSENSSRQARLLLEQMKR